MKHLLYSLLYSATGTWLIRLEAYREAYRRLGNGLSFKIEIHLSIGLCCSKYHVW